ncbi:MAG: Mg-chelatase subunit ChlD, partial [Myxococcota bacterium]
SDTTDSMLASAIRFARDVSEDCERHGVKLRAALVVARDGTPFRDVHGRPGAASPAAARVTRLLERLKLNHDDRGWLAVDLTDSVDAEATVSSLEEHLQQWTLEAPTLQYEPLVIGREEVVATVALWSRRSEFT